MNTDSMLAALDDAESGHNVLAAIMTTTNDILIAKNSEQFAYILKQDESVSAIVLGPCLPAKYVYELLQRFSERYPIVVTANHTSDMDELSVLSYGAADYVRLPCKTDVLSLRIDKAIRSYAYKTERVNQKSELDCIYSNEAYGIWTMKVTVGEYLFDRGNETFLKTFGYSLAEIKGKSLVSFWHNDATLKRLCEKAISTRQSAKTLYKFERNARDAFIEITVTPIVILGSVAKLFCMSADRTDVMEHTKTVEYFCYHDSVTGLYNRHYLKQLTDRLDASPEGTFFAVFDINGLKTVNDTFGHDAGDNLIVNYASLLKKSFSDCTVCCSGGDEFIVVGSGVPEEELSKRIQTFNGMYCFGVDNEVPTSISAGYQFYSPEHGDLACTMRLAEERMYERKFEVTGGTRSGYIEMLRQFMYERNLESRAHIERMVVLAQRFSDWLEFDDEEKNILIAAAILHDIGKIGLPKGIVLNAGVLNDVEFEQMKKHTLIGYRIALSSRMSEKIAKAIRCHHENIDGSGYPDGLSGNAIPVTARILAIIDSYDVMCHGSGYQLPCERDEALVKLSFCAGIKYDAALTSAFIGMIKKEAVNV